jgi:hypothetical protein
MTQTHTQDQTILTALADGSLDERSRRTVAEQVAKSPELRAELRRQRAALVAIRSVDLSAPVGLRMRIETERTGRPAWWDTGRVES